MNGEDYRAIIAVVERRLREVGADELANPDLYVWRDGESGEWRRLPSKFHLLDLLKAFDRWLAVRDGSIFGAAQERINEVLDEGRIEDAVVLSTGESGDGSAVSLRQAPYLGGIREDLRRLIGQLSEQPESGGTLEA